MRAWDHYTICMWGPVRKLRERSSDAPTPRPVTGRARCLAHLPVYFKPARPGFERDWRRVGAPVPTCTGQGKPELTEARRAEGIPEGQIFPPERRGRVDQEPWSSEKSG